MAAVASIVTVVVNSGGRVNEGFVVGFVFYLEGCFHDCACRNCRFSSSEGRGGKHWWSTRLATFFVCVLFCMVYRSPTKCHPIVSP